MVEFAQRQHGVVTRRQLFALGLSRHAVDNRIARDLLQPVFPGVYVLGGRPVTADGRRMAAVLACGPGAVLSHRSAARLWGVFPYEASRIEVSRPAARRTKHHGILLRQARLLPDEVTEVDGIPVTSIFKTIFDLAAVCSTREVERAFHETEVRQLTDRVSLPQLLERHPGRRGAGTVREILASGKPVGITRNDLEERFVALLDSHGLPRPRLNGTLAIRGRLLEPDCMWQRAAADRRARWAGGARDRQRIRERPAAGPDPAGGGVAVDARHLEAAAGRTGGCCGRPAGRALPLSDGPRALRALSERREPARGAGR